jgi:hypothetical protein
VISMNTLHGRGLETLFIPHILLLVRLSSPRTLDTHSLILIG